MPTSALPAPALAPSSVLAPTSPFKTEILPFCLRKPQKQSHCLLHRTAIPATFPPE
jgi:hypothetical protein